MEMDHEYVWTGTSFHCSVRLTPLNFFQLFMKVNHYCFCKITFVHRPMCRHCADFLRYTLLFARHISSSFTFSLPILFIFAGSITNHS